MSLDPANPNVQQPLNPDLAGYPTVEALVAAKRSSDVEAKRLYDENQKKDALLSQALMNGFQNGRQSVPDRRATSPEDRLTEVGVPADAMTEIIRREIQQAFTPLTNGIQARGKMVSDHPDYVQFETEVSQFIANDPDLSARYPKMFEADPAGAMEYAFLKFGDSRRRANPATDSRIGNPTDAAIPSSRAGEGRRAPDGSQALQEAYERYQRTGSSKDAQAYAKLRLHGVVKDEFLNQ
jgi:hypothetical protein